METAESLLAAGGSADDLSGHSPGDIHPAGAAEAPSPPPVARGGRSSPRQPYQDVGDGIALLPPYSRSLLKVEVTVRVTLASQKQPLQRILDLSPGSILQFSKGCDDPLALEVGGQTVALGEAVKVGDKFGLWITSMVLPDERFWVVGNQHATVRAK